MIFNEELVLNAYCNACFPMGDDASDSIGWYRPDPRTVIPLDSFHVPRSLQKILRQKMYDVRINTRFEEVVKFCRDNHPQGRWISDEIIRVYTGLHKMGFAHSLEIFIEDEIAGGLYGVSIGAAFFGESMFYIKSNCSKIALCELVLRMKNRGMVLLDTQFPTPHLEQFNIEIISDMEYFERLQKAIKMPVSFV